MFETGAEWEENKPKEEKNAMISVGTGMGRKFALK